jgi:hypothetical protein
MFLLSLWRSLRNTNSVPSGGKCLRRCRSGAFRPRLELLEGRALPSLWTGGILDVAPPPCAVSGLQQKGWPRIEGTNPIRVTGGQNSPETVIDLGPVFGGMSGIHHEDGLEISIRGNTNPGLVKTDLSAGALTLTYTPGKYGTATITVVATDADGVSVQQTIQVTIQPPRPAGAVGGSPLPARPHVAMTPGTLR